MDTSRAWVEIDLDALSHNLAVFRSLAGPRVALLLVAKADAYGHGAVAVCHHAARAGSGPSGAVQAIGVGTCEEAHELLRAGVRTRLVLLGASPGEEAAGAVESDVELELSSTAPCLALERVARRLGKVAAVHVKIDTGLNRLGTPPEEALALLRHVRDSPYLRLAGVMTHLAATEGDGPGARDQLGRFDSLLRGARARGLLEGEDLWIHAANSAAVLAGLRPLYDAVRVGIGAYGVAPDPRVAGERLRPVLSLRSRVVHLHPVRAGERVGYGGAWTARRPSMLATMPVGYDDGVDWRLWKRGEVLVRGRRVPVAGRISMDHTTIDVTDCPEVASGDVVTLLGEDGGGSIGVAEWAERTGTIPHAVLCSLGRRLGRVYRGGSPRRTTVRPDATTALER